MPNPTVPFLVLVTVTNSSGTAEPASEVVFSSTAKTSPIQFTNSLGILIFDIANIDYTSGETITITTNDRFNNDISTDTFNATGSMYTADITLSQRTNAVNITGYNVPSVIHTIGDKPVTKDNPLPVTLIDTADIVDLTNNPSTVWTYTGGNFSPTTETIT
ncbi:hypothetical protein LCGC14_0625730, partial [marine sediment metagenome]